MTLDTRSRRGADCVAIKRSLTIRQYTRHSLFLQLFLILITHIALIEAAQAHHATIPQWRHSSLQPLDHTKVLFPFKVRPRLHFTGHQVDDIQLTVCAPSRFGSSYLHANERKVRIVVADNLRFTEAIVNGLGYLGLKIAWQHCPARTLDRYGGVEIEIEQKNQVVYRFARARESIPGEVSIQQLWSIWDAEIRRKQKEAEAERRRRIEAQRAAERRANEAWWSRFWTGFWFLVIAAGGTWFWIKFRGPILAFYYHNFTSHPAEDIIKRSVLGEMPVDGPGLADGLAKATEAANPIEAEVRAKQAADLARKAREQSAIYQAQEKLADAMVEVERARRAEQRAKEELEKVKQTKDRGSK